MLEALSTWAIAGTMQRRLVRKEAVEKRVAGRGEEEGRGVGGARVTLEEEEEEGKEKEAVVKHGADDVLSAGGLGCSSNIGGVSVGGSIDGGGGGSRAETVTGVTRVYSTKTSGSFYRTPPYHRKRVRKNLVM